MGQYAPTGSVRARRRFVEAAVIVIAMVSTLVSAAPDAHAAVAAKVAPAAVPVGAGVVVTGDALGRVTRVTFLGAPGTGDDVVAEYFLIVDAKKIAVQVPDGAVTGPVAVTDATGTSATDAVKGKVVIVRPPTISGLSTASGAAGEPVVVSGNDLLGSKKPKITIGGKSASAATGATATSLSVKVPGGVPGGPTTLEVATDGGVARTPFYIAPTVKAIAGKAGTTAGGSVATITGTGFTGVDKFTDDPATPGVDERYDGVTIGGTRVTRLVAVSDTEIVVRTPRGTDLAATVVVRTTDGATVAASGSATVFEYQPIPTVSTVSQDWNVVGEEPEPVTISGVNLDAATAVKVGSTAVTDAVVDEAAGTLTLTPPVPAKPAVAPIVLWNTNSLGKSFSVVVPFAYVTTPTVTKVDPPSGSVGQSVTVTGTGFTKSAEVKFGPATANCSVVSFVTVKCTAPPGTDTHDVIVTTPAGTSAPGDASKFTYVADAPVSPPAPAPATTVAGLVPAYGATGSSIVITGSNLHNVSTVAFSGAGGTWIDAPNALVAGPAKLAVTVPAGAVDGPVRLTTPAGHVTSDRVFDATVRPSITSIDVVGEATYGATGGDILTIKGDGLSVGSPKTQVFIGGKVAPLLKRPEPTPRTLVVQVPASVGGLEQVTVVTPLGSATAEANVYFVPQVKSIKPVNYVRTGGVPVSIIGTGFTGAGNVSVGAGRLSAVTFGGVPVSRLIAMSDKEIIAVPARGSASADRLLVTTQHGAWTGSSNDVVRATNLPLPGITAVTPNVGVIGAPAEPVTITGVNLRLESDVRFGGTRATVQSVSANRTSMVVLPPTRTEVGPVAVTVTNTVLGDEMTAVLPNGFSYLPSPSVSSITPNTGYTGSLPAAVTIAGRNLRLDSVVRFNGTPAAVQSAAADGTSIVVSPPVSNDVGTVTVTVTNIVAGENLTATAPAGYSYQLAAATVTGKNTDTGLPGTQVTLTGTSFVNVSSVTFGSTPAVFTVANPTTIFATVPVTPAGLHGTAAEIVVVNGTNQPSTASPPAANDWVWDSHPIITSMTAATGAEGTTLTITGSGFSDATAVRFGSIDATSYTVVNDTTVQAVVPTTPSAGSTANVTVTARGLTSPEPTTGTANDWTWAPVAVITSMLPNPAAGGDTITVAGRNFTGSRSVVVNGVDVTSSVVVQSNTTLTFVAPPRPGGPSVNRVDKLVVVTNGSGAASTAETDPNTGKAANLFSWQ